MKNTKIFLIAALLGTVLASCQKEVEVTTDEKPVEAQAWKLVVNATMVQDTKAMSLTGNDLKSYWKEGETVGVYIGSTKKGTLTAGEITNDGANAVLSGELNDLEGVSAQSMLRLVFPDVDVMSYLGQDGSAPSESGTMATRYDYAMAYVSIESIDANTNVVTVASNAAFESQQSIYRLRFKDGSNYFQVSSITLSSDNNKLVRSRPWSGISEWGTLTMKPTVTPSDNFYYMAIRNDNTSAEDVYTFTVVRSSDKALFEGAKTIPAAALASPTYIPTSVSVSQKAMAPISSTTIDVDTEVL